MFNKRLFDMMKPKSFLVNTARGAIVNREDLVAALESGQLQGESPPSLILLPCIADHFRKFVETMYQKTDCKRHTYKCILTLCSLPHVCADG